MDLGFGVGYTALASLGVTDIDSSGANLYNPNSQRIAARARGAAQAQGAGFIAVQSLYAQSPRSWAKRFMGRWRPPDMRSAPVPQAETTAFPVASVPIEDVDSYGKRYAGADAGLQQRDWVPPEYETARVELNSSADAVVVDSLGQDAPPTGVIPAQPLVPARPLLPAQRGWRGGLPKKSIFNSWF